MDIKVFNIQGKPVGQMSLKGELWDGPVNMPLLSQAVAMYRTNRRQGTASTKTRAHVSGGGKKPWKQKHTGRARAGSTRSPLWRHGGSVFGPRPRPFFYRLPQQIRRKALLESLKGKLRDQELIVLDQLQADTPKTKPFAGMAGVFEITRGAIVLEQPSEALLKSLRNLGAFELYSAGNVSAFDVLNAQKVLVTKSAFIRLEGRVNGDDQEPVTSGPSTAPSAAPQAAPAKAPKAPRAAAPRTGRAKTRPAGAKTTTRRVSRAS